MMHSLKRYLGFIIVIFLAACTQATLPEQAAPTPVSPTPVSPTPIPAPTPTAEPTTNPHILGLMKLSFNRVGTKQMNSSLLSIESEDLSIQGFNEQAKGVDVKLVSNGAFSDTVNDERYVYATYEIRNAEFCSAAGSCTAYSDARENLTFLAVATDKTLEGSAFSKLQKFDGSAADTSIALDIVPTHGMTSGLAVDDTLADMQVFTEAEIIMFTPSGSSVTSVLPYGFVARHKTETSSRELAANPAVNQFDAQVTFAVKLPLQANPDDDPYKISLMVLVVDDSSTRVTESLEEQGSSAAESRADTLTATDSNGAEVALLGSSSTTVTDNTSTRICKVRTAGTAATPTAYLLNVTTGDCAPSAPTLNSFVHNQTQSAGKINTNITFSWDISASEGDPVDCELDMGDGTIYDIDNCHALSSQTHAYSTADIYTVTLSATDDDGTVEKLTVPTVGSYDSSSYNIDIIFSPESEWTTAYINVFKTAATRWQEVITEDLVAKTVNANYTSTIQHRGSIDDLVIHASIEYIDGVNGTLGQAGTLVSRSGAQPAWGLMSFDSADMASMASVGTLENVILHEMGHVLGIGSSWSSFGLIDQTAHTYSGMQAVSEYSTLTSNSETTVPIEDTGGAGSLNSHWDESTFISELMTSSISNSQTTAALAPLSRLTIGTLDDMGYGVDYSVADAYTMPSSSSLKTLSVDSLPHSTPPNTAELIEINENTH